MPVADDFTIDYVDKKVTHQEFIASLAIAEVSTVTVNTAESAGNYNGKHFLLNSASDSSKYYVWFQQAGGTDPAPAGRIGILVTLAAADTTTSIATKIAAQINLAGSLQTTDFTATSSTNVVTITNAKKGITTDIADGTGTPLGALVTLAVFTQGVGGVSIAEVSRILVNTAEITTNYNGKYFLLNSATDATKYYVWFQAAGVGTDPAVSGRTGILVAIASADTTTAIATKITTALNTAPQSADFTATSTTNTVTTSNKAAGSTTDIVDGTMSTLVTLSVTTQGKGKTVWSVNALYSLLQDTFDELGQMDDQVPMDAQTPTEYRFINGWFIDEESVKFLKGGAIKSSGWTGGIIRIVGYAFTTEFVGLDIGKTTVGTNSGGKILFFDTVRKKLWVRPTAPATDTYPSANTYTVTPTSSGAGSWTGGVTAIAVSAAGSAYAVPPTVAITVGGGSGATAIAVLSATGTVASITVTEVGVGYTSAPTVTITANGAGSGATAGAVTLTGGITGENIWANMFTLGTLESNSAIYVVRNGTKVSAWWPVGQIDVLIRVQEFGTSIDSGNLMIGAREYSKLYDHFISSGITGSRNPVPLATATDLNNTTGQYSVTLSPANITFAVGDRFTTSTASTKEGTITKFTASPATTIEYYLSGTSLTAFVNTDVIVKVGTTTPTSTLNAVPSNLVAGYTNIAITFTTGAGISRDLNNGAGAQPYHTSIDLAARTVAQLYEWLKFITRRGATNSPQLQSAAATGVAAQAGPFTNVDGEQYIRIVGTLVQTSTGVFTPVKASPFGTFAGGKFFGAQGVWITNYATADAQNFQLIDSNGVSRTPPNTVSVTVSGVALSDRVGVFVLTAAAGSILKTKYNMTAQAASALTITVSGVIDAETPQAGIIRVVQTSDAVKAEQQYEYLSYVASTGVFTLRSVASRTIAGGTGSTTVLTDTGATFLTNRVRAGDTVDVSASPGPAGSGTVLSITSQTVLTLTAALTGTATFATSQNYTITTKTSQAYVAGGTPDTAYVPILNEVADSSRTYVSSLTSLTNTLIKGVGGDIPVLVRVRQGSVATKILPFEIESKVTQTGMSQAAIRTTDSIVT